MFWGLIMEPNKRYTQIVEKPFHVSMAALDVGRADDDIVQVTLNYGGTNYLLCSLKKDIVWQIPLDLNFREGNKIAFTCNGQSNVHLTGYLIPEDDLDLDIDMEEDEEEEEMLSRKQGKRKMGIASKGNKKVKRIKRDETDDEEHNEFDNDLVNDLNSFEEETSDEDNENADNQSEDEDENDDDDDDDDENDEEDDGDDDDDDNDDNDYEDEEEEEEEEILPKKLSKQQLGNKNKLVQQQQQSKKKQDKQKLVNGKDVKQGQQKKNKRVQQQLNTTNEQKKKVVEGGVIIKDIKNGYGEIAKPGKFVSVYFSGRLQNGKVFNSQTKGEGLKFKLGKNEIIKGWEVGIVGMKVGGKRQLVIPPSMGYGVKGIPPTIPANSTLTFDIELKNVE